MSTWFVLVPIAVLLGFITFLWHRLAVAPGWGRRWVPYAVGVVLLALTALVLAGFDLWGGRFSPEAMRPWVWLGQAFLASWLYLFLGLVPVWLTCVLIWLVRWRHDHGLVPRRALNRVASPLVAVAAVGVTAYGAVEAAHPSVSQFEVTSASLPAEFDGTRVALVTDIHAGAVRSAAFTRGVVELVNAQDPDLVLIAGDLVDGTAARYASEIAPLAELRAPLGVFATIGNHEVYRDTANWVRTFEGLGLRVLRNTSVPLQRGGGTITLAGVNDLEGDDDFAPDTAAALAGVDPGVFTLMMAHQPLQAVSLDGRGIDLQVSGHTHGGQMWPLEHLVTLQQPMLEGLARIGDVSVVTSRGIGAWGPAIRVAAPPEVPIITLRRS